MKFIRFLTFTLLLTVGSTQAMFRGLATLARARSLSAASLKTVPQNAFARFKSFNRNQMGLPKRLFKNPFVKATAALTTAAATAHSAYHLKYRQEHNHEYQLPSPTGFKLTVQNFAGDIRIQGWDKDTVTMAAIMEANQQDAMDNTATVCFDEFIGNKEWNSIRYATTVKGENNTHFLPDLQKLNVELDSINRTLSVNNRPTAFVQYTLKTPFNTAVTIKNSKGDISVHDISGSIKANALMGSITTDNCANVDAVTTDGDIYIIKASGKAKALSFQGNVTILGTDKKLDLAQAITADGNIVVENANLVQAVTASGTVTKRNCGQPTN